SPPRILALLIVSLPFHALYVKKALACATALQKPYLLYSFLTLKTSPFSLLIRRRARLRIVRGVPALNGLQPLLNLRFHPHRSGVVVAVAHELVWHRLHTRQPIFGLVGVLVASPVVQILH